jgi:quinolinate synthase
MGDNVAAANPAKKWCDFAACAVPHMNQITLEDTLQSLQKERYVVDVPEDIRTRAARAVRRMIEIG